MAMSVQQLCDTLKKNALLIPCRGPYFLVADKKVGKEAAEDLPYGPRTPQTAKGGTKAAFFKD